MNKSLQALPRRYRRLYPSPGYQAKHSTGGPYVGNQPGNQTPDKRYYYNSSPAAPS